MRTEKIAACLLAAGQSTRFGPENKLLAPYGRRALIAHAIDALYALPFMQLFAVVQPDAPDVHYRLQRQGFELVENDDPEAGLSRSIALAAAHAATLKCSGLIVCLADMPHVSPSHVAHLCDLAKDRRSLLCSTNGLAPSPPAFFGAAFFEELQRLKGDQGARALLAQATAVEVGAEMLHDVDFPHDLERHSKVQ